MKAKGGKSWRLWLGMGLSLISVLWLVLTINWVEARTALVQANYGLILVVIGLALLTIPMRTARWRLLFPSDNLPHFGRLTAVMLIGQTINIIVPARAGDLARAAMVGTESAAYVLGTILVQTALDLLMLAGLVCWLLFQVSLPSWWRGPGQTLALTAAVVLLATLILITSQNKVMRGLAAVARRWPKLGAQRLTNPATEFFRSLKAISPGKAVIAVVLSISIWIVYGTVNYVLLLALHAPTSWLSAIFLLVVLQLGIAVPSSPGRVGVFHYLSVQALAVFDVERATAVSFAIVLHLISIMLPTLLGAILIWKNGNPITAKANA